MTEVTAQTEFADLRTAMIVATIIGGLLLMISVWPLSMSPMIFDSGESATTWGVFLAIWTMPVALIVGLIIGWIGFSRNARGTVKAGLVLAALPVLVAIGILVMSGF